MSKTHLLVLNLTLNNLLTDYYLDNMRKKILELGSVFMNFIQFT